jgi:septum formation protein
MHIYLASQSPRRQELLKQIQVQFNLLLPDASEDAEALEMVGFNERPLPYVKRVVRAKAQAAMERLSKRKLPVHPILVADTTVALGRQIFGKPQSRADHLRMLHCLSGNTHRVITGIGVVQAGQITEAISISYVTFAALSRTQIQHYIDSGEGEGKAGGYAVQGVAAAFIPHISGSYSGIMGLPLAQTAMLLKL